MGIIFLYHKSPFADTSLANKTAGVGLLQEGLEALYLADQNEEEIEDNEVEEVSDEVELVPVDTNESRKRKERQSQITDFFKTSK